MAVAQEERGNIITQAVDFGRNSWAELKKVQRPTRQETTQATLVVLFMVAAFAAFLGFVDMILGWIMRSVLT